jgi:hypothetical protein
MTIAATAATGHFNEIRIATPSARTLAGLEVLC